MLKVFIVEDEAPARRKLARMVSQSGLGEVCGEASSYEEAVRLLAAGGMNLVLLDVELGDGTGFEVLQSLPSEPGFEVIFCTAYDAFALEAFQVAAIDYLLKPVSEERLREALLRVPVRSPRKTYSRRILVERRKAFEFVDVYLIDWIEADRNYVLLHVGQQEYVLRSTMEGMEARLDPADFARVNRGAILRLEAIQRLEKLEGGDWLACLKSGAQVLCTKKYFAASMREFS